MALKDLILSYKQTYLNNKEKIPEIGVKYFFLVVKIRLLVRQNELLQSHRRIKRINRRLSQDLDSQLIDQEV